MLQIYRNMFSLWKSLKETNYVPFDVLQPWANSIIEQAVFTQMIDLFRIMCLLPPRLHLLANAHLLLTALQLHTSMYPHCRDEQHKISTKLLNYCECVTTTTSFSYGYSTNWNTWHFCGRPQQAWHMMNFPINKMGPRYFQLGLTQNTLGRKSFWTVAIMPKHQNTTVLTFDYPSPLQATFSWRSGWPRTSGTRTWRRTRCSPSAPWWAFQ